MKTELNMDDGRAMHDLVAALFPICRSLTGDGVRQTLARIKAHLPLLEIHEVPSGTQAFDWTVPNEWNIRGATLTGPDGETVADFCNSNLHVVGYSIPVDETLSLEELEKNLHSLPRLPDAIPYITSYYRPYWGFCLPHTVREKLKPGNYRAVIDSTLAPGSLTYGEILLKGETDEEVLLSTYICHPSMANNELSGPVVTTWLVKWLMAQPRRYTYRIVFIPETIGSIVYLSRNIAAMKARTVAGFVLSCMGDDRSYSFLPSRLGNTLADRVAQHVLKHFAPDHVKYPFRERGSDERQYCAPGVDLPVCSVMRTKYDRYPEYHTSLDNLDLVTPTGLAGGLAVMKLCLEQLEANETLRTAVLCEPQLGKRGLYPTISTTDTSRIVANMMDVIAYSDGDHDLLAIAEIAGVPMWDLVDHAAKLKAGGLLTSSP